MQSCFLLLLLFLLLLVPHYKIFGSGISHIWYREIITAAMCIIKWCEWNLFFISTSTQPSCHELQPYYPLRSLDSDELIVILCVCAALTFGVFPKWRAQLWIEINPIMSNSIGINIVSSRQLKDFFSLLRARFNHFRGSIAKNFTSTKQKHSNFL